jgi:hypothetical protein
MQAAVECRDLQEQGAARKGKRRLLKNRQLGRDSEFQLSDDQIEFQRRRVHSEQCGKELMRGLEKETRAVRLPLNIAVLNLASEWN